MKEKIKVDLDGKTLEEYMTEKFGCCAASDEEIPQEEAEVEIIIEAKE